MTGVSYTIKKSKRARRLRIQITPKGVTVTIPYRFSLVQAEKFVVSRLAWIHAAIAEMKKKNSSPWVGTAKEYHAHKARATKLIKDRVVFWSKLYDFKYKSISIKNQRSKWGSCTRAGKLNFNYRLYFLPQDLVDYVVVHELCHLRHMNHSRAFWRLVEGIYPEYANAKKMLRSYYI
ncbi:MAG: M48 family metallopeptidase [Candidatus Magasanikbacteria bacterium]|nr:M48 family metallopeptidase [Candidatus Magasanikbacteria bacterium]